MSWPWSWRGYCRCQAVLLSAGAKQCHCNAMATFLRRCGPLKRVSQGLHACLRPVRLALAAHPRCCSPALPFFRSLACFRHRALMANVYNDRMVPWCTATFEIHNMFEDRCPQPISSQYPSVVVLPPPDPEPDPPTHVHVHASGASEQAAAARQPSGAAAARENAKQAGPPDSSGAKKKDVPPRRRGTRKRNLLLALVLLLLPITLPLFLGLMLYLWISGK